MNHPEDLAAKVLNTIIVLILAICLLVFARIALADPKPTCRDNIGLSSPVGCVIATSPDPTGPLVDFCTWMAPDPILRDVTYMDPGKIAGHVVNDKIVYTKFSLAGDNWDSWAFDEDYIYFYSTGSIHDFVKAPDEHDTPWLPRYVRFGFPGTRLVTEGSHWQKTVSCWPWGVSPSSNSIMEVWGPTWKTYAGNLDTVEVVVVKTWWDCWGVDATSCTQEEDYTYAQPYGWIEWENLSAPLRDGNFVWANGGPFDNLQPGGSVIQDWCSTPSIFAAPDPPPAHKPVTSSVPFAPISRSLQK